MGSDYLSNENCSENDGIDHISNMPDTILCKILSQMPTKYALGTKILSTRWKDLSPFEVSPIKLDLDDKRLLYNPKEHNSRSFVNFVDKLLYETLRDEPYVESVFLRWRGEDNESEDNEENIAKRNDEKIVAWVTAALRLNVARLSIRIPIMNDPYVLLNTLNGCATLVELELGSGEELDLRLLGEFILPNLKSLFLDSLLFRNASINTLLGGCPLLNELSFNECEFSKILYVKSPLLKLFVISHCIFGYEVVFDAPSIEVLVYESWYNIPNWVGANFKSLHSAYIAIDSDCDDYHLLNLAMIVKACSSATRLCLSGESIKALHSESVQLSAFRNITWLALGGMESNGFKVLACFLKSAPFVQTITFDRISRKKSSGGCRRFESLLPSVPVCLKLCLKKIEFFDFEGEEDEMKLVEYFLKYGRVLQEVTFHHYQWKENTNIYNRLLMFPKHSETCQILVKDYKYSFSRTNRLLRRCLSFSGFYIKVSSLLG